MPVTGLEKLGDGRSTRLSLSGDRTSHRWLQGIQRRETTEGTLGELKERSQALRYEFTGKGVRSL